MRNPEAAQGCVSLALMYRDGRGVPADARRAFNLTKAACDVTVPHGCGELARFYRDGLVVTKDDARALELFDYACKHGDESGCTDARALRGAP